MYRLHKPIFTQRGAFGPVMALSPAAWYRPGVGVTGTLTVSNWADQSGNGRDLAQAVGGNQPINLPFAGSAYGYLPGIPGNFFSTPDAAANSPVDEIKIEFVGALDDWTPANYVALVSKYQTGSSADSYALAMKSGSGGIVSFIHINGATTTIVDSTAANGFTDGAIGGLLVTWDKVTGYTNFYKSVDGGVTWAQFGTANVAGPTTALNNGTRSLYVGVQSDGTTQPALGKCYSAKVYTTIAATSPSVNFDPSRFVETSTNGTTATMSTGEVWTLNSTGAKPAQIVKSASLLFDGTDDYLKTAAFTLVQPETIYMVAKQVTWTGGETMTDGDGLNTMLIQQITSTPQIRLATTGAQTLGNSDLAVGSFGIITAIFNGASSFLQINNGTAITGDTGAVNGGGLTLGGTADASVFSNFQAKELIAFSAAHSAAQRASVQQWLALRHAISL